MRVHFIAIGGSAMHNLAIALHHKGYEVTGSDDEIFEPSRTRLNNLGLLPDKQGWYPEKIHKELDAIILGMHARNDNPELIKARDLGLKIFSYPEYLYEQSKNKTRVVIGGSHGKTTITAMVLHVLHQLGMKVDYMVGAQLEGFEVMVNLSEDAPIIILEGDEYLSSALDPRPKFHIYKPNIALISGIAWDHMNVFPTFKVYIDQFREFIRQIEVGGTLIYFNEDAVLRELAVTVRQDLNKVAYETLPYQILGGKMLLNVKKRAIPLQVFGSHNVQNLQGAWKICNQLGVGDNDFLSSIKTFQGASRRLHLIANTATSSVYKDFAHSPSKVKATVNALKELYPARELVACLELHTYSSLNIDFLPQYKGCFEMADVPVVYFSPHALKLKKLPELSPAEVRNAFEDERIKVVTEPQTLKELIKSMDLRKKNLLMMSSGDFDGINLEEFSKELFDG
jgi:UDP-N-acetylmuramate: L-alanyl-gamma-D-glutamyl-meso-diaminopimelate ligase